MAEHSTPEERTEMPTDRRMGQLRRDGAVHLSTEVAQLASILSGFIVVRFMLPGLVEDLKYVLVKAFKMISLSEPLTQGDLYSGFLSLILLLGPKIFCIVSLVAIFSSLAVMLQTNWNIKEKKIDFKWPQINPISGLSRIFSIMGVVNTLKGIFKLAIILPVGYFALSGFAPQMVHLIHTNIPEVMLFTSTALNKIFWRVMYILMVFAAFDYGWTKYQWLRQNKMTKDEVKDERKSVEGDEETRRRIQMKGIQRIMQRIKYSVPKADVVVTNPTHYAIALKYDRERMNAPTVVAKGKGFFALRIREIAKEAGVPILERKTLARALYDSVEVGASIPRELFKAVAEVLAYVYRLKNPYKYFNYSDSQQGGEAIK